jgi:hypothetical protein
VGGQSKMLLINMEKEPQKSQDNKPISHSLERDNIEKRYPNLKILDTTDEMIGKTSLYTWIKPLPELNKHKERA